MSAVLLMMMALMGSGVQAPITPEQTYVACGCGCCGGVEPKQQCVIDAKELQRLKAEDALRAASPDCAMAGCSAGVRYMLCD